MEILKLALVFLVIVAALRLRRPLIQAIGAAIIATALLFLIPPSTCLSLIRAATISSGTWSMLLIFYLISLLQRILESRRQLSLAQKDLNGLFNNRRINASFAPLFIGLLPAAGAVLLAGDLVDDACGDLFSPEEKAVVTSYFRHIPESFLPTYSSVILLCGLCGVPVSSFVVGMFPMVLSLFFIGWIFYLRRLPRETGDEPGKNRLKDLGCLLYHLWTLIALVILILGFGMTVYAAAALVIVLSLFVYRVKPAEFFPMIPRAVEKRLLISTYLIMVLKEFLSHTGAISRLPDTFSLLPVPAFLVFALIFFFGTIVSGSTAIIAICTTAAFAAVPSAGMPLAVLLMSFAFAAMQISPTHVCLAVACERFDVSFGDLTRRTLPMIGLFCLSAVLYYLLLISF